LGRFERIVTDPLANCKKYIRRLICSCRVDCGYNTKEVRLWKTELIPGIFKVTIRTISVNEFKSVDKVTLEGKDDMSNCLDIAEVMLLLIDLHSKVILANKKTCEILQYQQDEVIGKNWFDVFVPRAIRCEAKALTAKLLAGKTEVVLYREEPVLTKYGEQMIIGWHITAAKNQVGKITGIVLLGRDITKIKPTELHLRERIKELDCLYSISRILERPEATLGEICREAPNLICRAWQYPEITCAEININNTRFKTQNFRKTDWCLSSYIRVNGVEAGEVVVCYLEDREERDEGPFLKEERLLLDGIAEQLGRVAEHLSAEESLRKSERLYHSLFDNISDGVMVHDLGGNIIMVNPAMAQLTGYAVDELTKMKRSKVFTVLDSDAMQGAKGRQLENDTKAKRQRRESKIIRKDGEERIVQEVDTIQTSAEQAAVVHTVVRDITWEKQTSENIRAYATQIIDAQERERQRIARDLHDETVQGLVSLGMDIDSLIKDRGQLSEKAVKYLVGLRERTEDLLKATRYLCRDLRPAVLEELGLYKALEWLIYDLTDQSEIDARFEAQGSPRRLSPDKELAVFRVAQEALRNVIRHARATMVIVKLEFGSDRVKLLISDNGQGFELPEATDDFVHYGKMGLMGMVERARLVGGTLAVLPKLNQGTTVTLEIPT